jgi:hypothetical protein
VLVGVMFLVLAANEPVAAEARARMIVIATADSRQAARREARRAASLLDYPVGDSWAAEATQPTDEGRVIGLLQGADDKILVTAYVGGPLDAEAELVTVKKRFPKAAIVATTVVADPTAAKGPDGEPMRPAGIVIVSSHISYRHAVIGAKAFSAASGVAYSTQGMIYDDKRGLIWPDDSEDDVWAGSYAPRRDDLCGTKRCVTIERAASYGLDSGGYVVVAGIVSQDDAATARAYLRGARKIVPSAFIKLTTLYMGCMH